MRRLRLLQRAPQKRFFWRLFQKRYDILNLVPGCYTIRIAEIIMQGIEKSKLEEALGKNVVARGWTHAMRLKWITFDKKRCVCVRVREIETETERDMRTHRDREERREKREERREKERA
tara:strand:+ start:2499 stop:2855 length:357 start_codon:yes stop_codon:yes gene_type:complete